MTKTQAVRAFRKWAARRYPELHEIEAADAGFDGGEWSRGFHGQVQADLDEQVRARLGITEDDVRAAEYREHDLLGAGE